MTPEKISVIVEKDKQGKPPMKKIKADALKKEFKSILKDGVRPDELIIGSLENGGTCSYKIKNSKSYFPDINLDVNEFVVFSANGRRFDYSFVND